jgi:internalin A
MSESKLTAAEAQAIACQRIEENLATRKPMLDLGDLPLDALPESIRRLEHLDVLSLGLHAPRRSGKGWFWESDWKRPRKGFHDLGPLAGLTRLSTLSLGQCEGVGDLGPVAGLTRLTWLRLDWCDGVRDLGPLAGLTRLSTLDLTGCEGVRDLGPLAGLIGLTSLDLYGCWGVRDLGPLAGLAGLTDLNLADCRRVDDLGPLAGLAGLTSLSLYACEGVRDLGPLAGLIGLTSLNLYGCWSVRDLAPLAGLTHLSTLVLQGCTGVRRFRPIRHLLDHLTVLRLFECIFDDLPAHLCGNTPFENVIGLVRSHDAAQETQQKGEDAECKLFVVGNGATGKTSMVRLILGEPHRDDEPTTHAIHLGVWNGDILLEGNDAPGRVRVNIWDFGGQDLYHETHRLFFQSGAVYLVLWDPRESERPDHDGREWYTDKKRPLQYWIDQIVAVDPKARILVVRNKADLDGRRPDPDWREQLPRHQDRIAEGQIQFVRLSAKDRGADYQAARGDLFAWLAGAVAMVLGGPEKRAAGKGRLAVKGVLRGWQAENDAVVRGNEAAGKPGQRLPHPFITRATFDELVRAHCAGSPDAEDTSYVLEWLHRTGVVFWNKELFGDRILVDQRWAIQGIYTLLDRERSYPRLLPAFGRFTARNLAQWAWDAAGYNAKEQRLFLEFMQACGLCFLLLKEDESATRQAVYVAPEYLPGEDNPLIRQRRAELRRGLDERPAAEVSAEHPFLGEGVAGMLINRVGAKWSRSAVLWKWGAAFPSGDPGINAVGEVTWSPLPGREMEFGGKLRIAVWGPDAPAFLGPILETIRRLPGFPAEAVLTPRDVPGTLRIRGEPGQPVSTRAGPVRTRGGAPRAQGLDAVAPSRTEAVGRYVSFSVAGTKDMPAAEAQLQQSLLQELKTRSAGASYHLIHYQHETDKLPEKIDALMHEIAHGDLVLVFLSERYLRSKFCMTELVLIYDTGEPSRFPRNQAKLWRLPSARRHLNSTQPTGRGVSAEILESWWQELADFDARLKAALDGITVPRLVAARYERMKRIDPCWPLFELLGDDTRLNEFLTALTTHGFEPSPLTENNASPDASQTFAREVAESIHRRLMSPAAR